MALLQLAGWGAPLLKEWLQRMSHPSTDGPETDRPCDLARWLLESAADGGVGLTETHALARAVVREAVARHPDLWDSEVHGAPYREADVRVLSELHAGLRRLKLVRRRGRRLLATARAKELIADPEHLLTVLAADMGGGDDFGWIVADAVGQALLGAGTAVTPDDLKSVAASFAALRGWMHSDGSELTAEDVGWDIWQVISRGEAYGLLEHQPDPARPESSWSRVIALTEAGARALAASAPAAAPTERPAPESRVLVFEAELLNAPGVGGQVAVGESQQLVALHQILQQAFGWGDDHLYSFWLDGQFWGEESSEYTSPINFDGHGASAELPIAELDLTVGSELAYLFDFGDEWRVRLRVVDRPAAGGREYPRVLSRRGQAPPQYS